MAVAKTRPRMVEGIIFATILIDFLGFSLLIPVLPLYAEKLGASPDEVGLILSLYAIGLVLALPIWGWISDRIGRRPVILVCLVGTALAFSLLAFADTVSEIYLARVLGGFFGASIGTAQAYIADITGSEERARGMGLIGAAFGIGFVLGNAMGGLLYPLHPEAPFWTAAGLALGAFLLGLLWLPESRARETSPPGLGSLLRACVPTPITAFIGVHSLRNRLYFYLFFHMFASVSALEAMFPLFAARIGWDVWETGLFLAYIGLVVAATQAVLIGPMSRRVGEVPLVATGLALTASGMLLFSTFRVAPLLLVAATAVGSGIGITFPTFTSLFSKVLGPEEAGEYMGHSQSMAQTGRALGPYWGGWAMLGIGITAPFWLGGLGLLAALAVFLACIRFLVPARDASSGVAPGEPRG
jgi:MFS family permease